MDLIIVGAGGLGREVLQWALDAIAAGRLDARVRGFLDDTGPDLARFALGVPVLGPVDPALLKPGDACYVVSRGAIRRWRVGRVDRRTPTQIIVTTATGAPGHTQTRRFRASDGDEVGRLRTYYGAYLYLTRPADGVTSTLLDRATGESPVTASVYGRAPIEGFIRWNRLRARLCSVGYSEEGRHAHGI
jgi:hypothetical protein